MRQLTHKRLTAWLLTLVMALSLLPTTALAAGIPNVSSVFVDGKKQFYDGRLYYRKGDESKNFTGNENDYIAHYDPTTGKLTLNGYSGGSISVGGVKCSDITVVLKGTNTINGSLANDVGGDITITGNGTLSITNTLSGSNPAIGIETGWSASYKTGNVTIKGNAEVTISMTHNGTLGWDNAYGIFAKGNITISGGASVGITCATPNNTTGGDHCNGLRAVKDVIIDTTGTIKIDVKNAGGDSGYSFGIYPSSNATLNNVGNMEVKWKKHTTHSSYPGGAIVRGGSFNTSTHAVNVDTTNCYASYRKGTPYQVTAGNGTLAGPGVVSYANNKGNFLAGDKVSITPATKKGRSGEEIPFKEWTSSDVMLDKSATTASNSFTVPDKNVTVIAEHSPFVGPPTFTPIGDLNNQGVLTFKTMVKPGDGNEYFALVKVGNEGNYNNGINPDTSSQTKPYVYTYKASSGHSSYYVEPGEYYVAEKLNNWWYLSEKFTVNYVKPHPEISVSYWPNPTDFGSVNVGYDSATGRILTIDNKGEADTGELTITVGGENFDAFTVSPNKIPNIAASGSATSTVRPANGLPAGIYTATLKISGDNVNTLRRNVKFTVKDPNASATVSGTVTSYGDAGENVTVTLTPATGTPLTTTLTGAAGTAPYSQTYSFSAVPAGTYTLKVEKKGHAPWTEEITVGTDNIGKDVTVYLWGDVNGDGKVKNNDLAFLARHLAEWPGYETLPVYKKVADLNQDGLIKQNDSAILERHLAGWPGYEVLPKF